MATIESLRERLRQARAEAERERLTAEDRAEQAAREAERPDVDLWAEADRPARVLTDDEAIRRAVGGAPHGLAAEIAEMAHEGLRETDLAYRENLTGA
jgi:hypothetical protein